MVSMCRAFSCVVGRGCLLWPVCSLGKPLLALPCFILYSKLNLPVTLGISWLSTFAFQSPIMKRISFWDIISRRPCRSSLNLSTSASFNITGQDIDLDYCDFECFALEMNRDHSVVFEIASKYCISDFCWLFWLLHFFWGIPAHSSRYSGHLS